jgi:hypothetical protein
MKLIVSILLTALVAFALGLQLPWFTIAIAAFIVAMLIPQKALPSYLSGFLGVFLLWTILALLKINNGGNLIATQMASIFPLKGNVFLLVLISAFIGAIVAGCSALSGYYCRKLLKKENVGNMDI